MIPKIIHFCWFGGNALPKLALECIASWRKYLPEHEIWMWVEKNNSSNLFTNDKDLNKDDKEYWVGELKCADRVMEFDVDMIPYTKEAYAAKKYAFVSDYARFWVMYKYGGIYFDTDVEVIRPLDDIIEKGNFMGFETDPDGENSPSKYAPRYSYGVALGLGFGINKEHVFMKDMMEHYKTLKFTEANMNPWLMTIVAITTQRLDKYGLKNKKGIQEISFSNNTPIYIYPREYFAPINVISGRLHITDNTVTIHRYMGSWDSNKGMSTKDKIKFIIPEWLYFLNNKIKRRRYKI